MRELGQEGGETVNAGWGKLRRLERLRNHRGQYLWLALDHGLSRGALAGMHDLSALVSLAAAPGLSGVVTNRGVASMLPPTVSSGLVLQAFGRPEAGGGRAAKVPTCRVEDAIRLAADAVSVQLDLGARGLSHAVHAASLLISDAASYDIPVLAMVTPARTESEPYQAHADAIRICTELGADLIKIGLPTELANAHPEQLAAFRTVVGNSPPLLVAGGERDGDLSQRTAVARELGFSGACIGRSVFQDSKPDVVLRQIVAQFDAEPVCSDP